MKNRIKLKMIIAFFLIILSIFVHGLNKFDKFCYASAKVTEKGNEIQSSEMFVIPVSYIEINDYEKNLEVEKTMNLTANVVPSNATDSTITYTSSNPAVATVNSSGEVKGISQGSVTIHIKAGNVEKDVTLNVKVSAVQIEVNFSYLVLKPQEEFQLNAKAIPEQANQNITYRSKDETIASVSNEGKVTAKAKGTTTIIVSNSDISNAVTVIVNDTVYKNEEEQKESGMKNEKNLGKQDYSKSEQNLIDLINKKEAGLMVNVKDYQKISKNILKKLYEKKMDLIVNAKDYTITLKGDDIKNYENELNTEIEFFQELNGTAFVLNNGKKLPGNITFTPNKENTKEFYIYLYNETKNKYEKLGKKKMREFVLNEPGKYLILEHKMSDVKVSIVMIAAMVIVLAGIIAGYVGVKKKYWFW
ncbi:Ig-like domain-containing protein [Anaerosacchariphilus polymeriproducens]|uniref:BIG2 domain-containing protein n=1 Tax=Anaerosacchariphilus polymeriproducens TaxID=1812858 RepID=A0A371AQS6_9FIRM|nr:Ig-like domain-containing protein [Anaerosacchariphilus polymeriproducens]RDU21882.1 hypothetical protein DWV06_18035 [Anaerosacchariphilus polymeriproducens]